MSNRSVSKQSKPKTKLTSEQRTLRRNRIIFVIVSGILILSWVLSLIIVR